MNKEIEEMANLVCDYVKSRELDKVYILQNVEPDLLFTTHNGGVAEALYNAGYRKTVWHKVADGDLPPEQEPHTEAKQYWCHYADDSGYTMAYFNNQTKTFYDEYSDEYWSTYDITDIDYWTELPKYEGEE